MARSLRNIESALAQAIEQQNGSIDTQKGPVYDIFIAPQAQQVRRVELLFDDLSRRYSLDYVQSRNPEVLRLYGANHGMRRSPGRAARGNVVFFTYSAIGSDEIVSIPAGTVVTTADSSIAYRTTRDAYLLGSSLSTFFNASTRRYEIRVPVEALGQGGAFEIPAGRIRTIQTSVPGIDGVLNRERIEGGTETESNSRFGARIRSKFNGLALGSGSGLEQLVRSFSPSNIDDVTLIYSTDEHFRRRTRRSSWDVYLIGSDADTTEVNFIGDGVTRAFTLPLAPVLTVVRVTVGGSDVSFSFSPDTTDQFRKSSQASDKVVLDSIPAANEVITVEYQHDKLIRDVQQYVDTTGVQLYRSDILVRKAIPVPIRVKVLVEILSSFDETEAASSAFAAVSSFMNQNRFVSLLFPDALRNRLSAEVAGVAKINLLEFTRAETGTIPIEAVEFKPFEYPQSEDSLITVQVRR